MQIFQFGYLISSGTHLVENMVIPFLLSLENKNKQINFEKIVIFSYKIKNQIVQYFL